VAIAVELNFTLVPHSASDITSGRGPIQLMSPRRILKICGSSSMAQEAADAGNGFVLSKRCRGFHHDSVSLSATSFGCPSWRGRPDGKNSASRVELDQYGTSPSKRTDRSRILTFGTAQFQAAWVRGLIFPYYRLRVKEGFHPLRL
jgi:hypothetical protein